MEHNRTRQLHLRQQVEIPQNEKHLTLRLKLRDHELLIRKQVVILFLLVRLILIP